MRNSVLFSDVVIMGAGGFAKELACYALEQKTHTILEFFDETAKENQHVWDIAVDNNLLPDSHVLLGVGKIEIKEHFVDLAKEKECCFVEWFISDRAYIGKKNIIGVGAVICPGCVITTNVMICDFVTINLNCTIGHNTHIGRFCTIAPGVHISGDVTIGDCTYIGTGAVIREGVRIGAGATIGMGAVVLKDVPNNETWVGNPARKLR
jgi:sugar O-acyltransferase (sialic acid O-acetyltransferase NeuD family)